MKIQVFKLNTKVRFTLNSRMIIFIGCLCMALRLYQSVCCFSSRNW